MKVKQIIALVVVIALLMTGSVLVTFAYLTREAQVRNTFTVGDIQMKLDESIVDLYGRGLVAENGDVAEEGETVARWEKGNNYKLIPGHTYTKDPTVTIKAGSEPCYVRMLVTVNNYDILDDVFGSDHVVDGVFLLQDFVDWNAEKWPYVGVTPAADGKSATYEFRYNEVVDAREGVKELEALFTTITIDDSVKADDLKNLEDLKIDVVAHAIQTDGFANAAEAWSNFTPTNAGGNGGAQEQP